MTTEVSRSPRAGRGSVIGYNVLASPRIDIGTEAPRVDSGRIPENRNDRRRRHESVAPQGSELAYRHTVASYDEGLSLIEPAHDFAAVVAELALGDGFSHSLMVAQRATDVGCLHSRNRILFSTHRLAEPFSTPGGLRVPRVATHALTFCSSRSRGTAPERRTSSWKAR